MGGLDGRTGVTASVGIGAVEGRWVSNPCVRHVGEWWSDGLSLDRVVCDVPGGDECWWRRGEARRGEARRGRGGGGVSEGRVRRDGCGARTRVVEEQTGATGIQIQQAFLSCQVDQPTRPGP